MIKVRKYVTSYNIGNSAQKFLPTDLNRWTMREMDTNVRDKKAGVGQKAFYAS